MRTWLLACNAEVFDLDSFRRDGQELRSWSVVRHRKEMAEGDRFVMWLTGPRGGLIGRGRLSGVPTQQPSSPDKYWRTDPGTRWYAPLVIDGWLENPVPRSRFTTDARFAGTTTLRTLFAGNPHRLNDAQWQAFDDAFVSSRAGDEHKWTLQPGDTVLRKALHDRYGGSRQGGISKCAKSSNVLLFTDPRTGHQHGYFDAWAEDGTFHYTGDGQKGDQDFTSTGNSAIRDHVRNGLALRLFEGSRGTIRYVGEFVVDPVTPYTFSRAPETGGGELRRVIRFHLVPVGASSQPAAAPVGSDYRVADESVEPAAGQPSTPDSDLTGRNLRAHRRLQNDLAAAAAARGLAVLSPSATDPDFDLAWRGLHEELAVCEVKSLTRVNETRQLRAGIGQLLDYHDRLRGRAARVRAVLWVEREPTEARWLDLCERVGIELGWPGREDDVLG
nr:EVE domain-containing protein [Streptomyces noursei]